MKISLIIPTFNEENCIGKVINEVPRHVVDEIIIVDGWSTDNTRKNAQAFLRKSDKLILQKSTGYGSAFLEGFKVACGDILIMMDGDGSHNPADIPRLINKINAGYDYVLASRYVPGGSSADDTFIRFFGNQLFTKLTNLIHHTNVTDSLYLFTAITANMLNKLNLTSTGFEFCTEILVKAKRAGLKFAEIPAHERQRYSGKSKVNAFWHGTKILRMILKKY